MTPVVRRPAPREVRFYFSYRSPYAWFATTRLPALLAGLPVELTLRPVWEPDEQLVATLAACGVRGEPGTLSSAKRRYIFEDVRRHARAYGLLLRWPIDRQPQWARPHLGLLFARDAGRAAAYHTAIFARRFSRGEDVTDPDVLADVAREVGLDPFVFRSALADGRYDDETIELFREAAAVGVFGWPFFVYGRHKFWGNDRLEWLVATIRAELDRPELLAAGAIDRETSA